MLRALCAGAVLTAFSVGMAAGQTASFTVVRAPLASLSYPAISPDGDTIVGSVSYLVGGTGWFRWTRLGGLELHVNPGLQFTAVSQGGSVIGGSLSGRGVLMSAGVVQPIPISPSGVVPLSVAAISPGGDAAAGNGSVVGAYLWRNDAGTVPLAAAAGFYSPIVTAISDDGSIAVGEMASTNPQTVTRACRWVNGGVQDLGTLPGWTRSGAIAISGDGRAIFGYCFGACPGCTNYGPFRWTEARGMEPLPVPAGVQWIGVSAVSRDGGVCVGMSNAHLVAWTRADGIVDLEALLRGLGVDLLGIQILGEMGRPVVSASGRRIAGWISYQGAYVLWIADLPLGFGCYANCDSSLAPPVLNINDFICFLNRFVAGDSYANCDDSAAAPVLNVNDFMCFVNRFAEGCP